ncbi:threonylcarbamoyladenosine tRNA methylthiotransferase [Candidatus Bathyarchaeota archaeon ex4484_205]|nr:MAG: threonylcarbamoyladenosine tRNA methylthiotransferase [Candidatus Bathyarchaeota archaeon ex4484_205]
MKIFIKTWGCAMNKANSYAIEDYLSKLGHIFVSDPSDADVIILNTCNVKSPTEQKVLYKISELYRKYSSKLIITGCMALTQSDLILNVAPKSMIVSHNFLLREDPLKQVFSLPFLHLEQGSLPPLSSKPRKGLVILPIAEGCLGNCSYCIVRLARGRLRSYPPEYIERKFLDALSRDAFQFWLTAQDTGVYGWDICTNLPQLLKSLLSHQNRIYRIRVGMMNPKATVKILDDLLNVYSSPCIFKFFHIPVQSGDPTVLNLMNRGYSPGTFIKIVDKIRSAFPYASIVTDIIVGFPGEDEEAFNNTVKLLNLTKPHKINISKFTPRPYTPAAKMKQIPSKLKKERSKFLSLLSKKFSEEHNKKLLNKEFQCLITEQVSPGVYKGRAENFAPVYIHSFTPLSIGVIARVKITNYIQARLIAHLN